MRTVIFTYKSSRGAEILKQFKDKNVPIEAIFIDIDKRRPGGQVKNVKRTTKRIGPVQTARFIQKKVKKMLSGTEKEWHTNDFYRSFSDKVYNVKNFNGEQCEQLLQEIEPDLIILGGSRIIRKNIIRIPKIGILNAHPGLLPKYRGVDVIPWAIYYGDPVGVTIHFIDEGIDTGGIVAKKIIDITPGDTLNSLLKKANRIAGALMAEAVLQLMNTGHIEQTPQEKGEGKQFYRMAPSLRQETELKLQQMLTESSRITS